jgi:Secretion system C-terminal sorting domain
MAQFPSLAINSSAEPYVAYMDYSNSCKATVMKFDGTNWVNVGNAGFSPDTAKSTSLAINSSGEPYVVYEDYGNSEKATVMKFDGTNWVNVGNEGFSEGPALYTYLALSQFGQPYVAYSDSVHLYKATVMYYDGPTGIDEQPQSKVPIYPNPATDKITIEIAEGRAPSHLSMMTLNGEEVLTRSLIKPKTQIDISNLPSGVYFVRLTNDKMVEVGKFIKQ